MAISDLTMAKAPAEARSFSKPQIQRLRGLGKGECESACDMDETCVGYYHYFNDNRA